jgi:coenzyme F420 hydrogenase subunit beta
MKLPVLTIRDVVERQLCVGCGACASARPDAFAMDDSIDLGRRPFAQADAASLKDVNEEALKVCPGVSLEHTFDERDPAYDPSLRPAWGPVLRVWEGHATDDAIRRAGSSGGAATALALFAIERLGMRGVVHAAARGDAPHLNMTVMSTTREALLERTGSRYAPASPCEGLGMIEASDGPCVFIGKPCDAAGAQKSRAQRASLDSNLGLVIAFFCAGTPSTRGTLDLLRKVGCDDPSRLTSLRYRGNGWPGMWTAKWTDARGGDREASLTYEESWDFLQRYRQWRCYICPDHTGEFADVAVGDPWYRKVQPGEPGSSLILARTKRGMEIVERAAREGYLTLTSEDSTLLPRSQPNLLRTRARLFGQLIALRAARVPTPRYRGFPMFRFWLGQRSARFWAESIGATWKRVKRKGLRRRIMAMKAGS